MKNQVGQRALDRALDEKDLLLSNERSRAITRRLIEMAHDLGIKVTAEGIENKEQYQFLLDHHCDYIQGFLFSKPMPLAELEAFLT